MDWKNPKGYILFFKNSNGEGEAPCATLTQHMYKQKHKQSLFQFLRLFWILNVFLFSLTTHF